MMMMSNNNDRVHMWVTQNYGPIFPFVDQSTPD